MLIVLTKERVHANAEGTMKAFPTSCSHGYKRKLPGTWMCLGCLTSELHLQERLGKARTQFA